MGGWVRRSMLNLHLSQQEINSPSMKLINQKYTPWYVKQTASGKLLYSAENSAPCPVMTSRGAMGVGEAQEGGL